MTAEQLRNSILQEAISGHLVPQDPNDEPASVLLARIREEKARLVKEGTIKAKDVLEYTIDEIPYELPDNWSWVKLGDISYPIKRGKSPVYVENSQYIAFAQKCNTKKGYIDLGLAKYIESKKAETQADIYLKLGDIVINSTGTGTLGRVGLFNVEYPENIIGVVPDSHVATVRLLSIYPEYAYYFLRTCQAYLESLGEGGTNQKELKPSSIAELLVPLPPLAEQKRIVAKLEELLPIVEQYGKAQTELDELNAALPARLRQSILQEAISGRLVPQDPNDEPASVLLERIVAEQNKTLPPKKKKSVSLIAEPEDITPVSGWAYFYIKDLFDTTSGGTPIKGHPEYYDGDIPWVRSGELNSLYLYDSELRITEAGLKNSSAKYFPVDTVVIAMYGATIGKTSIFKRSMTTNQAICGIFPIDGILPEYIYYFLQNKKRDYCSIAFGSGQPNISQEKIKNTIFPLPPLAEQQRLVAKIEELFEQIDKITK